MQWQTAAANMRDEAIAIQRDVRMTFIDRLTCMYIHH